MKKIVLFVVSFLALATTIFADNLVIDNQTSYPAKMQKSKMAVQWADSAKEVQEENKTFVYGGKLNSNKLQAVTKEGKISLAIPEKAQHFRVLVWSKEEEDPDLITNWVDIVPNKTYILQPGHLVPTVLMSGMGC